MAAPERPRIDRLLSEAGWVRELARGILAQPLRADDATQEAWLAALKRAPPANTRAWLAAVARNALRKALRAERRRAKRERAVARPEAEPSALEVIERFSTHHAVATAVLELEEPLRETILLRYYEGLTLAAIAERTGVAVATVADRLESGQERLRERLRRRFGGDEGVVAALWPFLARGAPGGVAPDASPGGPSGAAVSGLESALGFAPGAVLGLACVVIALGALTGLAWMRGSGGAPSPEELGALGALESTLVASTAAASAVRPPATGAGARRPVALDPSEPLAPESADLALGALRVRVAGASEVMLRLRPERTDVAAPPAQRAAGGSALFAGLAPGLWHVEHAFGPAERVHVRAEGETTLELPPPAGRALAGRVVDDTGAPVPFAAVWLLPHGPETFLAGRPMPTVVGAEHVVARADDAGCFRVPAVGDAELVGASAAGHAPSLGQALPRHPAAEITLRLERAGGAITGRVVDPAGAPVAGAAVHLDAASAADVTVEGRRVSRGAPHFRALTDAAGAFHFDSVRTGARGLLVSAPGCAPWRGAVAVAAGATATHEVRLERGASVHGTVTDEAGQPLAGVLVFGARRRWIALPDERFAVATRTGADGAFALEGLPAEAAWLVVEGGARGRHAELLQLQAGETRRLDLGLSLGTPIRGRVVDERGGGVEDVVVRAWRPGDAASLACRTDAEGRFVLADCEEETYEVLVEERGLAVHRERLAPSLSEAQIELAERNRPSATIRGTLVDPSGGVASAAAIELTDPLTGRTLERAVTERADGSFLSEPVPPGEYVIAVRPHGRPRVAPPFAAGSRVRLGAGERLDLGVLTADPGLPLELDLARADGAPLYFLTARILSASGGTVEVLHVDDAARNLPLTVALLPGDYELSIEAAGTIPLRAPLHVTAESAPRLALLLEPLPR